MSEEAQTPLTEAGAALAATEARLAAADRRLLDVLRAAHRVATEANQRLADIGEHIDAAAAGRSRATPASGREFGHFLVAKNREIAEIVAAARAESEAKAVVLQELVGEYRVNCPDS